MTYYTSFLANKNEDGDKVWMVTVFSEGTTETYEIADISTDLATVLFGQENDFIRYTEDINQTNEVLNKIEIPVLVIFGDIDECVLTQPIDKVKSYLTNNIKNCNIKIINGADHSYSNKYEELGNIISENF